MKDYWDRIIDKELEQRLEAKAKPSLLLRGENPRLKMYPMSLYESRESSGEISLKELFDNPWLDIDGIMRNSTLAEIILWWQIWRVCPCLLWILILPHWKGCLRD